MEVMERKQQIGIITYHNAINFGAVLQTFALNKYINSLGINCETINYHCKKIDAAYKLLKFNANNPRVFINSLLGVRDNIIKKIKFKKFIENNIKLSKQKYNKNNIVQSNSIYNIFITGSDQVWNLDLNDDKNYYLDFVKDNNSKNSYAASFGNMSILDKEREYIKEQLNSYDVITVREKNGVDTLKEKLNIQSNLVLDPTFLLDSSEWLKICDKIDNHETYILVYTLHEESAYKIARKLSKLTGFKIIILTQSYKKRIKGKHIHSGGPVDFLTLIKNSEYVVTDSFHGTALSIIFRKNLKVVLKNSNKHLNDRLISILELFHLKECIITKDDSDECLTKTTDYTGSEEIINKQIEKSKKIIKNIIKVKW